MININCAQKGFRRIDGCLANALLMHTIIKSHRRKISPCHIVTLDLKKAFDTVSVNSMPRALVRVNVHPKTIKLISNMYTD